jgi:hypothetical protein
MNVSPHIFVGAAIAFVPVAITAVVAAKGKDSGAGSEKGGSGSPVAIARGTAKKTSERRPALFDWKILKSYDVTTGKMPAELRDLNNEYIRIPGFVVPLEDNSGRITEFLLVPSQMSCIHVPPPPPNFIFYVRVENKGGIEVPMGPIWLTGQLSVGKADLRGESYFLRIDAVHIEPYRAEGR